MTLAILDIETVVEPWWQPPPDDPDRFAPAPAWRVICACVLVVRDGHEPEMLTWAGDEPQILRDIATDLGAADQIVTWNGRRFDLPVVMARSLVHGLEQGWYYGGRDGARQDARYRYAGPRARHLDLADQLSDYGAGTPGSLDTLARALGLPDGKGATKGRDVAGMYARGEHEEIARYCARDVLVTALVWTRWCALVGDASEERTARREAWIRERLAAGHNISGGRRG